MPRGPAPKPNARRRNTPTIPTTELPAAGRKGRAPNPPKGYDFGPAGREWWRWAWRQPQAMGWDKGALYFVARRASLEDDLAAIDSFVGVDIRDLLSDAAMEEGDIAEALAYVLKSLRAQASGKTALMKEMRELENRLGLNPKALVDLRWTIVEEVEDDKAAASPAAKAKKSPSQRRHLRAVG